MRNYIAPRSRSGSHVQKPGTKVTSITTTMSTAIITSIHGISFVTPVLTTVTVTADDGAHGEHESELDHVAAEALKQGEYERQNDGHDRDRLHKAVYQKDEPADEQHYDDGAAGGHVHQPVLEHRAEALNGEYVREHG